jgi:hypothetical protein
MQDRRISRNTYQNYILFKFQIIRASDCILFQNNQALLCANAALAIYIFTINDIDKKRKKEGLDLE